MNTVCANPTEKKKKMRAVTIDNQLLNAGMLMQAGHFKVMMMKHPHETFEASEAFEEDDRPLFERMELLHPETYEALADTDMMDPNVVYHFIVISDCLLHRAVELGAVKLVEYLLAREDVDVDATDDDERTALSYSVDADISTLLIQAGADVNHSDFEDNTVMHHLLRSLLSEFAAGTHFDRIVSIVRALHVLCWNGADADLPNEHQVTCRQLYHSVFPEGGVCDEDAELREFFQTPTPTSFPSTFPTFSSSSSSSSSSPYASYASSSSASIASSSAFFEMDDDEM